jgi:hypothetical protein
MSLALFRRAAAWVLPPRAVRVTCYVWIDTALLDSAHADSPDTTVLSPLVAALDPSSCAFGAAVADLVTFCSEHGILVCAAPISAVAIEPTRCDRLHGGFRVLTGLGDRITLASPPLSPQLFRGADELITTVLAVIVEAAGRSCRDLLHDAAHLARAAS